MKETRLKRLRQKAADLRKTADRLFRAGDPAGAAAAYRRQARVLRTCGEMGLAAEACRRAVALNPGDSRAHCERGLALQALGRLQAAESCLRQAARLDPDNPRVRFLCRAVEGRTPDGAPPVYVRELFDRLAEDFDRHLKSLDYRLPSEFEKNIRSVWRRRGRFVRGIDLGCGTGLIGRRIRPAVKRLSGVDISPAMIRKAEQTGVYDHLAVDDVCRHLNRCPRRFDLLVAGDVLIYMGDLDGVFKSVKSCCKPGGVFVFSVEERGTSGYVLRTTARFAHSRRYVLSCIEKSGMTILRRPSVRIRREKQGWARGRLYMVTQ